MAVESSKHTVVEFLLLQGADIELTRKDGKDVFDLVTDQQILELLASANGEDDFAAEEPVETSTQYNPEPR